MMGWKLRGLARRNGRGGQDKFGGNSYIINNKYNIIFSPPITKGEDARRTQNVRTKSIIVRSVSRYYGYARTECLKEDHRRRRKLPTPDR